MKYRDVGSPPYPLSAPSNVRSEQAENDIRMAVSHRSQTSATTDCKDQGPR